MHIDFRMQFEILPVSFKTLHHSFPDESQLQKRFFKMDDHLSSETNSEDQNLCRKSYMREYMRRKRQNIHFQQIERNKNAHAKNERGEMMI